MDDYGKQSLLNFQIEAQMIVQQERASNTPFEVSTQLNPTYKVPTDKKQPQARYVSPALPIHSLQLFILAFQIVFQPLLCQSRYCSCGIFSQVLQTGVGGRRNRQAGNMAWVSSH